MVVLNSILMITVLFPLAMQANITAKSCLQLKESSDVDRNGFYILYDSLNRPFTTFCDFHSDTGFVWTLIESLSLANARKAKYRRGFYYDVPTKSCSINWLEFRLCKAIMKSIADSVGSTHFRATCNFNTEDNKGLHNHRDYMRVSFCSYPHFFRTNYKHYCTKMDYINIRGHTCRQCSVPLDDGGAAYHALVHVNHARNACDRWSVPNTIGHEYAFGSYQYYNSKFSCCNTSTSTTNWWIGGSYIS